MTNLTAILTVWKRNNLERQLDAVFGNSVSPDRVIVYQNEHHVDIQDIVKKFEVEHIWSVNCNHKYHSRFTIPLFVNSRFFAIYDDDTIPGRDWHRHSLNLVEEKNCVAGSNGRSFVQDLNIQVPTGGVSNRQFLDHPIEADFVGHAWTVTRQHIYNMWSVKPLDFSTGEDMHLSLTNKIYFGIPTFVPSQQEQLPETWGDIEPILGLDEVASFKTNKHQTTRDELLKKWIAAGWKPTYQGSRNESNSIQLVKR